MHRFSSLLVLALAAGIGLGLPLAATAQSSDEMSTEEITKAFKKQKTRGLVIVPTGQQSDTGSTDVANATPTNYNPVAREDQVNVQIKFDFDSAALRPDQKPKLANLCAAMKASGDVAVFQIIGHTDSSGSDAYNQRLSLLRAQEVKRHLVGECGISAKRLEAVGLGETAPLNASDPRADENRRVEFQALG